MRLALAYLALLSVALLLRASPNSERAHSLILSADSAEIYGEQEDRAKGTVVTDKDWLQRFAETMGKIEFKGGDHVLGIGYLTVHFMKDGVQILSIGIIPGDPCYLRAQSQRAGADFVVTKEQYEATRQLVAEKRIFVPPPAR